MGPKTIQDVPIGKNIRDSRVEAGLTQEQLAAKLQVLGCDISREMLAKMESGARHVYASEIKAIKEALNIEYDHLFRE